MTLRRRSAQLHLRLLLILLLLLLDSTDRRVSAKYCENSPQLITRTGTNSRNIGFRERAALAAMAAVAACTAADGPTPTVVFGRPLKGLSLGGEETR